MSKPSNGKVMMVKGGLSLVGLLCIGTAVAMFFMGQTAGHGSSPDDMTFFALLLFSGLGCFVAVEWYSSRVRDPVRLHRIEDDEEESEEPSGHGGSVAAHHTTGSAAPTQAQASGGGGGGGGGDGADRMNHLEHADFIFAKVKELDSEEKIAQLIHKSVAELQSKGYSAKGMEGFKNKLAGNLSTLSGDGVSDQVRANRQKALQVLSQMREE